jgi:predicted dinucleotide-binding enzyme
MKILIIGGTGTIGKSVADKLKPDHEIIIASKSNGNNFINLNQ